MNRVLAGFHYGLSANRFNALVSRISLGGTVNRSQAYRLQGEFGMPHRTHAGGVGGGVPSYY